MEDQKIKEILIEQDTEFRRLFLQHQEFESDLLEIQQKAEKDDSESIHEQNIKKQKLKVKDAMQRIIYEYKRNLS